MKKILMFPVHALWQAIVLPLKILVSSLGLTFRLGFKAGALPVRGGAVVTRALGWKILGAITVGMVLGVLIGRQLGRMSHDHDHHDHDHDHHDHDHDHDHDHHDHTASDGAVEDAGAAV